MWKKIDKYTPISPREARTSFAVARGRSGHQAATLIVPGDMVSAERANIYSDGNGKLAFHMCEGGAFKVSMTSPAAKTRKIAIPADKASRIPFGTTDVQMTRDGDMWVLDLNAIPTA